MIELEGGDFGRHALVVSLVEVLELKWIRERFLPALFTRLTLVKNTSDRIIPLEGLSLIRINRFGSFLFAAF